MARKRKKGTIVLELLKNGALNTAELLVNVALEPLRHPYKGVPAYLDKKRFSIREAISKNEVDREEKRRFYNLLVSLKRDGLISKDDGSIGSGWVLSEKGKMELERINKSPEHRYKKDVSNDVIIISYDIPERHRTDRGWIRSMLQFLDFTLLHQSVWVGKTKIPEEFLSDMRKRKIAEFVHVFTVGKKGSLDQIQ